MWNLKNNFEVQLKIVSCHEENSKIWGQTLMMHSLINAYLIGKLQKILLIMTPILFGSIFHCDHSVSTSKDACVGHGYMDGKKFRVW